MFKIIKAFYVLINALIIIGLLLVHFVFKECSFKASLFYYSFPLPVIILIVLILSIFLKRKIKRYNLVLAAILLLLWLSRSFKIHFADEVNETDLEIVFWNASHDKGFEDAFNVNEGIPDVFVLVENGDYKIEDFQLKYPKYYFYKSDRGISVFSKTPLYKIREIFSKFSNTIISFETANVNFYAIDAVGSLDVPRAWSLRYIDSKIDKHQNAVLLGDFNLPFESKYLSNIKANFNHAFNEKGNGFRETWFWNIPLLSLDHIWVSKDLKILKTEKISTFKSDHNMIKTIIRN